MLRCPLVRTKRTTLYYYSAYRGRTRNTGRGRAARSVHSFYKAVCIHTTPQRMDQMRPPHLLTMHTSVRRTEPPIRSCARTCTCAPDNQMPPPTYSPCMHLCGAPNHRYVHARAHVHQTKPMLHAPSSSSLAPHRLSDPGELRRAGPWLHRRRSSSEDAREEQLDHRPEVEGARASSEALDALALR